MFDKMLSIIGERVNKINSLNLKQLDPAFDKTLLIATGKPVIDAFSTDTPAIDNLDLCQPTNTTPERVVDKLRWIDTEVAKRRELSLQPGAIAKAYGVKEED